MKSTVILGLVASMLGGCGPTYPQDLLGAVGLERAEDGSVTILFVVCQGAVDEATLDRIDTEDNDESTRAPQIGQWNRTEDPLGLGVHVLNPREPGSGWTANRLVDDFAKEGPFVYDVRATGQLEDKGLRSASSVQATRAEIDALEPGEVLVNDAEVLTRTEFDTTCAEPTDAESGGDE